MDTLYPRQRWYETAVLNGLLVVAVVAATPRIAVLDFAGVNVQPQLITFASETFAARLAEGGGVTVTTQRDISNVLGLERQKQLMGCGEEGSCVAELAGALGVDGIAAGQLAQLGDRYQLTMRVTDPTGKPLAAVVEAATEAEIARALAKVAQAVRLVVVEGEAERLEQLRRGRWIPFIPMAGGLALGGVGATLLVVAATQRDQLVAPDAPTRLTDEQALGLREAGRRNQTLGLIFVGSGAAALLSGLIWRLVLPEAPAITLAPTADGGALAIQGAW